jgi:hypothetical protein
MSLINKFKQLMTDAHEAINKTEEAKEAEKINTFRVGSSGAIVEGEVYSTQCGRLAQARFLGYQSPPTQEMRVMFNGGLTFEDFLAARFTKLGLKFHQERQQEGEIAPGIVVSGRPDFEVETETGLVGIEVKSLASPFSVMKQRKNRFPYMKHMIQAATYMTLTGLDSWLIVIGHSFHVNDRGMKIPPALMWYELKYVNGKFIITNDNNENALLPFDKQHIISYYREQQDGIKSKQLMARPKEYELNVDTYNRCNYCPMKSACNEYDKGLIGFEQWLSRVVVSKEKEQSDE